MKIFAATYPDNQLEMIPDSSLVKDSKPFFIPGLADDENWQYMAGVALRVSRLGKSIQPEFALRYADAATVCVMPRPVGASDSILNHCFDGAIIVGRWLPIESLPADGNWLCRTSAGTEATFNPLAQLPQMLEHLSEWMSMKMGDILVPQCLPVASALPEGTLFEASLAGNDCLSFRIK